MIKNQIKGRTMPIEYGYSKTAPKMRYVRLGNSGLKVSRLIMGTATYGIKSDVAWRVEEEEAPKHLQRAWELDFITFDTSNFYCNGLEEYYNVSYLAVSLLFLSPVIGFIISTLSNHVLHSTIGRRGMAPLASASQIIAYTIACFHPPFYALVVAFAFIGLGAGLKNASWNGFISGFKNSNELLGLLHGFYGLGATILPLISSFLLSHGWKCFYLLAYVGSEVALGGWLVTFMVKVRHGSAFKSGIVTSGLWAGITLGRICLGFVTGRFFDSKRVAVIWYLAAAMALELMFWLIPNFVSSAICVSF
ncbi:hypothetical protein MRS44_003981 [Fusarium solani]|uniref:uncharacterized protein n=1 Tax=Fusarium solani TaxID=169388 RepID=UPI0032C41BDB|nr:hypothetical protein MRS44_003981 [Fusarium solani]